MRLHIQHTRGKPYIVEIADEDAMTTVDNVLSLATADGELILPWVNILWIKVEREAERDG